MDRLIHGELKTVGGRCGTSDKHTGGMDRQAVLTLMSYELHNLSTFVHFFHLPPKHFSVTAYEYLFNTSVEKVSLCLLDPHHGSGLIKY